MAFEKALKTLEYNKILEMLSSFAHTEGAKLMARSLTPTNDVWEIRRILRQTTDALEYLNIKGMPSFGNIVDISFAVDNAKKGASLSPETLLEIANVLRTARGLSEYSKGEIKEGNGLAELFEVLYTDKNLENRIYRALPSADTVADDASPALSEIRRKIRNTNSKIRDTLQKYINSAAYSKYLQENIITIRNGRYVIPVKVEYKNEVKGLVHDTSSTGSTLFIEPMPVVDANNELRELENKEKVEIERILYTLSAACADISRELVLNYENITLIAFIFAKAEMSLNLKACEPEITEKREYNLISARHPLLDKEKVVPISVSLGIGFDTLVITGPNTGGKTVSLKTLGLLALMAQSGLHIPCSESSSICIFSDIHADIGDEQSIEQSLSTFSSHMVNIIKITKQVTKDSLVLFDELGAGTDPVEGAALAMAVLEHVRKTGALCAATTHYAELKAYALETDGVTNGSCEFDVNTLKPTYRLIIGTPGKSNAFEISSKLGLDENIVSHARELVSKENKRFEEVIGKLDESRIELENRTLETERMRADFEKYKSEAESRIFEAERRAEKELKTAREQATRILGSARMTSEFVLEQLDKLKKEKDAEDAAKRLEDARNVIRTKLKFADEEIDPVIERKVGEGYALPRPLKIGDEVLLVNINKLGIVTKLPTANGTVEVQTGSLKTKTNISNLVLNESVKKVEQKKEKARASAVASFKRDFKPTIDVRGQTGDDAWFMIDKYFDDAKISSVRSVTILHGKGTGALRTAIWKYLKKDNRVESFRAGKYGEGDYGVTVVELK
ncbi:MAG: endonuclease MutS2 [Ruminococcaceae bacterium]|nr:endonuclease MutS2 [Oscillospiraceae bacterium]